MNCDEVVTEMAQESAAAFDSLQPISRRFLTERAGALAPGRRIEMCHALRALADC